MTLSEIVSQFGLRMFLDLFPAAADCSRSEPLTVWMKKQKAD